MPRQLVDAWFHKVRVEGSGLSGFHDESKDCSADLDGCLVASDAVVVVKQDEGSELAFVVENEELAVDVLQVSVSTRDTNIGNSQVALVTSA